MANSEISLNDKIADVFRAINTDWRKYDQVSSENTDGLLKKKALRPDILIIEPGAPPICVETEYEPGMTVEVDAASRLGQVALKSGGLIQSAFAIRIPNRFKTVSAPKLLTELRTAQDFQYCVLSGSSPTDYVRWPASGYVQGSLEDVFVVLQGAATPQSTIQNGADALESGASEIAAIIDSMAHSHPGVMNKISAALKQEANLQTFRMAACILINAFVFQENLAGRSGGLEEIRTLEELGSGSGMTKKNVITEWTSILTINYWPIFGIARSLLEAVPTNIAADILQRMHKTASALLTLDLGKSSDLAGVIFQRLITDRRFLATFYTSPASAALLNGLVFKSVALNGKPWSDPSVTNLRIADFACGTGSLLCGAYNEVRRHLEISGVSSRNLHASFIEGCLVGCDVMPSATHITASILSSAFPEQRYKHTNILTLPFGRQADGSVSLGAIEFLSTQGALSIIDTGAKGIGATGEATADPWVVIGGTGISDASFDLVIMNPPFTRLTGGGGKTSEIPLPMFAAFGNEKDEQELMSARTKNLTNGTCAHGNAGEASIFVQVAHNKVRHGGYLALVLPLTFLSGAAWENCRELIRKNYKDIVVVTIAGSTSGSFAFSADTDVGECLLVAQRSDKPTSLPLPPAADRFTSVSLTTKPTAPFEGTEIARLIRQKIETGNVATLEGGPLGGTALALGAVHIGEMLSGPLDPNGQWPLFRIADHSVAQVAYQLVSQKKLWLPSMATKFVREIRLSKLEDLGEVGPYHLDIDGSGVSGGASRGPFKIRAIAPGHTATYPMLSSHDADHERTLEIGHDSEAVPRVGKSSVEIEVLKTRRERIWETRSRLHVNTDFRFNSQSLTFSLTPEPSLGGRAWPTFKMKDAAFDTVASLWANSTLGLLTYWWSANKAQDGRGSITTTQIPKFPILDPRTFAAGTLKKAEEFYGLIKAKRLLPAHQLARDPVRAEIDEFVLEELLRVDAEHLMMFIKMMTTLRMKLGSEPSFNGGK
jgi:hypothetical protein